MGDYSLCRVSAKHRQNNSKNCEAADYVSQTLCTFLEKSPVGKGLINIFTALDDRNIRQGDFFLSIISFNNKFY